MKWYEFTRDNGDGSYSKRRFTTLEEAEAALDWLENNVKWWCSDGDGVTCVDTSEPWFFDSLDNIRESYAY